MTCKSLLEPRSGHKFPTGGLEREEKTKKAQVSRTVQRKWEESLSSLKNKITGEWEKYALVLLSISNEVRMEKPNIPSSL